MWIIGHKEVPLAERDFFLSYGADIYMEVPEIRAVWRHEPAQNNAFWLEIFVIDMQAFQ